MTKSSAKISPKNPWLLGSKPLIKGRIDLDGRFSFWPERTTKRNPAKSETIDNDCYQAALVQTREMRLLWSKMLQIRNDDRLSGEDMPELLPGNQEAVSPLGSEVRQREPDGNSPATVQSSEKRLALVPISVRMHGMLASLQRGHDDPEGLGLSKVANSRKRVHRGSRGMTREQSRLVRNAAIAIEKLGHNKKYCTFATLTIPQLSDEDYGILQNNWQRILKEYIEEIRRELKRTRGCTWVCGCIEIQPERYREYGIEYPHLHLIFTGRLPGKGWRITTEKMDSITEMVMNRFLKGHYCWSAANRLESIVKSVSAYLGKYLSKGLFVNDSQLESGKSFPIHSWVVCSNALRKFCNALASATRAIGEYLYHAVVDSREDFLYVRNHRIAGSNGNSWICCTFGQFKIFRPSVPRWGSDEYIEIATRLGVLSA